MSEKKQLHLGVFLQGVGHTIAWRHPEHAKFTEFETYVRFAQTAERGKFDFIFFGEGLVVREHQGRFFGPIVNGRPDTIALLPALAAVTEKIGLAATISSTYNAPYELAPTCVHRSRERAKAAGTCITFSNSAAMTPAAIKSPTTRKEKHLIMRPPHRAREFVTLIKKLWTLGGRCPCGFQSTGGVHPVEHHGAVSPGRGPPTCRAHRRDIR
jgi:alkanesulfonate monooxygenase SsuD/methylene tetrahydromethanopterin reductase-like flavin-dependent oxidoreductase (luciferase family)